MGVSANSTVTNGQMITPEIALLSHLIERNPAQPVYYVLRGEEWLACGHPDKARPDFLAARDRAAELFVQAEWGYILQAYVDRAEAGLLECR